METVGLSFEHKQFGSRASAHTPTSLFQSVLTAIAMCHRLGAPLQTFIFHSSGGCKFQMKVPADLVPPENPLPGLHMGDLPPGPPHHRQHLSQLWNHLYWPSLGSLIWLVLESNVRAIAFGLIQENYLFGFVGEFPVHFQPRGLPPSPSSPTPELPRTYTKLS